MSRSIEKPMLAAPLQKDSVISYPVLASPKVDGIRALVVDGKLVTRTFKKVPNEAVRTLFEGILPDGADGELVYGSSFQESSSMVMSIHAVPDLSKLRYYWFDYVTGDPGMPYDERMQSLDASVEHPCIVKLLPETVTTAAELDALETRYLAEGFEGVILRHPTGRYKFGRSTLREGLLLKLKRFEDAEAEIVGFEELMHNANVSTKNAVGFSTRSSHQANLVGQDALGAFVVRDDDGREFKVGVGFTAAQRREYWADRDRLVGSLIKFKSMSFGVKDNPRHPVFLGFRDRSDL